MTLPEILKRTAVGFDALPEFTEHNYPRYNIIRHTCGGYTLEVAVPGWKKEDLEVRFVDGKLTVRGTAKLQSEDGDVYLHKGLSSKMFERTFNVSAGLQLGKVTLAEGILKVPFKPDPKDERVVTIFEGA